MLNESHDWILYGKVASIEPSVEGERRNKKVRRLLIG